MKYIYLLLIIPLISACSYKENKEDYNYLKDNSVRFIRNLDSTSLLINWNSKYYLLLLGKDNIDIEVDYLIKYQNINTNIKSKKEFLLNKNIIIDDLIFKINDKIEILLGDKDFCIYVRELDKDNYQDCDFIYLYNPSDDFYITLNSDLLILFYEAYTKFNYKFMYHLATVWIDSYTISPSSYTTLTITSDNFEVSTSKIRGKTIHKKVNS